MVSTMTALYDVGAVFGAIGAAVVRGQTGPEAYSYAWLLRTYCRSYPHGNVL